MYFANGANERMMNEIVHREASDEEAKSGIDPMDPSNDKPCSSETFGRLCTVWKVLRRPLGTAKCAFGLMCGGKLDDVGDEEMARNDQVEDKAKKDVLSTIVVAADTYENSILKILLDRYRSKARA